MNKSTATSFMAAPSALAIAAALGAGYASAGTMPAGCAGENGENRCVWSVSVDNAQVLGGSYQFDQQTGEITMVSGDMSWSSNGVSAQVGNVYGNVDPILGFSLSASTGSSASTFAFSFSLPIVVDQPFMDAHSEVSYSLTATSAAGAQVQPLFGKVVTAQEVDSSIGGLAPLNKGVDVGDTFFFTPGPGTQNSPVYMADSFFAVDPAYDLMAITAAFTLSANSNVGMSGFVEQTPVPVPAAFWLMGSALAGLGVMARKRKTA